MRKKKKSYFIGYQSDQNGNKMKERKIEWNIPVIEEVQSILMKALSALTGNVHYILFENNYNIMSSNKCVYYILFENVYNVISSNKCVYFILFEKYV